MASYRFSASMIKRSAGRSVVAASAYRAAEQLQDHRYGEAHDYTRKGGVVHTEIMTPDNTPEWMRDREQLWNAVEAIEKRKDAQLAREIQLSLPHELDDEQRRDLVRAFVAEQFVERGMIADLAIHAPHRQGDQRNHHAHVMLTLRELTGEGFGKKAREWNDRSHIEHWREQWAEAQNRTFERLGIEERVDHRSFEAQGIDREPEQHEGPDVTAMRRRGESSRVADENDRRQEDNRTRAQVHHDALIAKIERQRERFESWAAEKQAAFENREQVSQKEWQQGAEQTVKSFEQHLDTHYGEHLGTVRAEITAIERRLDVGWIKGTWRKITGRDALDRKQLEAMQRTAHDAEQRMAQMRVQLQKDQEARRVAFEEKQENLRREKEEGIERARQRKEEAFRSEQREWWQRQTASEQDNRSPSEDWRSAQEQPSNLEPEARSYDELMRESEEKAEDQRSAQSQNKGDGMDYER